MIDLIRKRHPSPGWVVVEECSNGTGTNLTRYADAVALGIWPSHGFAIHGYEFKRSKGDVQRELDDPSKADAVGKYCDYWWLVVSDLKLIDGLVLPETWGVLYQRGPVLRVHRKAPKREATAVNRSFAAAIIRRVTENWVTKREHEELKKNVREVIRKELDGERRYAHDDVERQLQSFRTLVEYFERESGINLTVEYDYEPGVRQPIAHWQFKDIAPAVKLVVAAREMIGQQNFMTDDPVAIAQRELDAIERVIEGHERAIAHRKGAAANVRALIEDLNGKIRPQLSLLKDDAG